MTARVNSCGPGRPPRSTRSRSAACDCRDGSETRRGFMRQNLFVGIRGKTYCRVTGASAPCLRRPSHTGQGADAPRSPGPATSGTDSEGPTTTDPGGRYYQLSHDYLVHSLRDWLTRKQRETRRGRAELRLAERSSLWNSKPE